MFNYKKVAYLTLGVATLGSSILLMSTVAGATPIASKMSLSAVLAQTFHLNQNAVQNTIKQYDKTHHHKKPSYINHLAIEVKKGKITTTQEQAIITEHDQIVQSLASLKGDTPTQKKATLKQERTSAKAWAKTNNIPVGLLYMHHHQKTHGHNKLS